MWDLSWHLTLQLTEQQAQCATIDGHFAVDNNAQIRLNGDQYGKYDHTRGAILTRLPEWFTRFQAGDNLLEMATNPTDQIEALSGGGIYVIGVLNCDCDSVPVIKNASPSPSPSSTACKTGPEGCTYPLACNFDVTAEVDDGSCLYPADDSGFNCDGTCQDDDNDLTCNNDEVFGCTYDSACNYDVGATEEDGSCEFAKDGADCNGESVCPSCAPSSGDGPSR